MGRSIDWVHGSLPAIGVFAAGIALPLPVLGAQYFTVAEAQKALFPDTSEFVHRPLTLSAEQRKLLAKGLPSNSPSPGQGVWEARSEGKLLGFVVVDEVIGKHDLITFAVALDPEGSVKRVEILEYREPYGYEVRNGRWLRQFAGKRYRDSLQVDREIQNISGATMSCEHVTAGVRRVLILHDMFLRK